MTMLDRLDSPHRPGRALRSGVRGVLLLLVAAAPRVARAEDPGFDDRTLKDHVFLTPMLQESAFVTTHFGFRQGFAYEHVPSLALGSKPFNVNTAAISENAELGFKITDWIGIYGTLAGFMTTGLSSDSLVYAGSSYSVSAQGGLVGRIVRIRKTGTQISARASATYGTGEGVELLPLMGSIMSELKTAAGTERALTQALNNSLINAALVPTSFTQFTGSVHVAQTLAPMVGLQVSGSLSAVSQRMMRSDPATQTTIDDRETNVRGSIAAALSVDGSNYGVPVAGMFEYAFSTASIPEAPRPTTDTTNVVSLGIYYTGARNLLLGIGAGTEIAPKPVIGRDTAGNPSASGAPSFWFSQIVLRHIW